MHSKSYYRWLGVIALLLRLVSRGRTLVRLLASSDSTALVGASVGLFDEKRQLTSGVSTESAGQFVLQADP